MSRKPNDMTARKPSTKQAGKKKPTTVKRKSKKTKDVSEETPITISGGSIIVESLKDRQEPGVNNHKKCKIKDPKGKKWTLNRVDIYAPGVSWPEDPLESFPIKDPNYSVVVVFKTT